jgi:hypothetical protein
MTTDTQEIMANEVKEAMQYEQQYDDTEVEHILDDFLGDLIKESITASVIKNKRVENELTIAETMKEHHESLSRLSRLPVTATS